MIQKENLCTLSFWIKLQYAMDNLFVKIIIKIIQTTQLNLILKIKIELFVGLLLNKVQNCQIFKSVVINFVKRIN